MKKMHPIVWAILCLPVVYFAMVTASVYIPGENIFALLERISTMVRRPDLLRWTAYTPRFLLVFLLLYGGGVLLYYADHENRRPGEEYGSAKWGNARELNKRYAERDGKNVIITAIPQSTTSGGLMTSTRNGWNRKRKLFRKWPTSTQWPKPARALSSGRRK